MGIEKLSEAILDKVKVETQDIIREAEEKAQERIEKAREQHEARFKEEKSRLTEIAETEASRVQAQASIMARLELLNVKKKVIEEIVNKIKEALSLFTGGDSLSLNLIREAVDATGVDDIRVYVSPRDMDSVQKLIKEDKKLSSKIKEIKAVKCIGGAIVEDVEGKLSIDNTYETRLEMLLPRILPEISKELFGAS